MKTLARVLLVITATLVCATLIRKWCVRPVSCNVAMTEISAATFASNDLRGDYAREQRVEANLARLHELEPQCRTDVRLYVLMAGNESIAGRHDAAVHEYERALTIDRRPEIYIEMGNELIQLGRTDDAVESFVTAARFSPGTLDAITSEEVARRVRLRLAQKR